MAIDEDDKVKVLVKNNEINTQYSWDLSTAHERKNEIKFILDEKNAIPPEEFKQEKNNPKDPFW